MEVQVQVDDLKTNIFIKNLETISHLHEFVSGLSIHWKNDREQFFANLALWFEQNLGAQELSVIFNDLKIPENEEDKPKLIKSLIVKNDDGEWHKSEPEKSHLDVFEEYKESLELTPRVLEFGVDNLTFGGSLTQSPFLIVCRFKKCSALQQALLKGLFSGLDVTLTP